MGERRQMNYIKWKDVSIVLWDQFQEAALRSTERFMAFVNLLSCIAAVAVLVGLVMWVAYILSYRIVP
jgi:hypothetical protein